MTRSLPLSAQQLTVITTAILQAILFHGYSTRCMAQDRWSAGGERNRQTNQSNLQSGSWGSQSWIENATTVRQWQLGIAADNTSTGVLVRQVSRGSAAERARLEAGDIIVAVEGFQVGLIGNRLYDLTEELNRRADASGAVQLLLQDHITNRLASVRVQLDSNQDTLKGLVVFQGNQYLPSNTLVTVQIENVTRPYAGVKNGQTTFLSGSALQMPFEINFDSTYIYPTDTYRVRAYATLNNRTIAETTQSVNVLTNGAARDVQLVLVPISNLASGNTNPGVVTAGYPNYNYLNERITQLYQQYLRRSPTSLELAALKQMPGIENRMDSMHLEIMAAQEYFDLAGNNEPVWIRAVFSNIVGRQPTNEEAAQWLRRYQELNNSRSGLLRQLVAQTGR